jgi:hypothetical protein
VERHRIARLCLCLVHLLSAVSLAHNTPTPNRHHHCSRRIPLATPLTGVRGSQTTPSAAPSFAPVPVRPLDCCRYRKTSASRTPALLSRAAPSRHHPHIGTLQPAYQGLRASLFYLVEHLRTPTHHPGPWRRQPLRVALSRYTIVSASYHTTRIARRHAVPNRNIGIIR